ncbi:CDK2-associated and cullin domain-containing protein 1-like [Xenia sp. Carnegie-2017]|uniref:CDK2-associated and cullin domain-containing protein 1-like n=1 Tax=Xenia sp. Carnegie-2017 TaxID=2897299 RepID=UPI001F03717A|nr:CDK2-associated and cullin domain-containing protein 1-like [Xenia sp. Carnegie-2017]
MLALASNTRISDEDYYKEYWPKLRAAIHIILRQKPGEFIPISYEETYSAVYKCVCFQHSEKLYENLMTLVNEVLTRIKDDLESQPFNVFLKQFAYIQTQYFQSVEGITAVFNYMNRFYVQPKKNCDLKSELLMLFSQVVADNERLFEILEYSVNESFSSEPDLLMTIVRGLYTLRPDFAQRIPDLFSRFIPNLVSGAASLDQEIMETLEMQDDLREQKDFMRNINHLKRSSETIETIYEGSAKKLDSKKLDSMKL